MLTSPARLLVLDDDPDVGIAARLLLQRRFGEVRCLERPTELAATIAQWRPDLLLLDMNFLPGHSDGAQGLSLLRQLRQQPGAPQVIVMTAYAGVELAVQALKAGALDFVTKPWDHPRLLAAVAAALALRDPSRLAGAAPEAGPPSALLGQSPPMQELRRLIAAVAATDAHVLVLGEMGAGKELVARELHERSPRRLRPLLAVDLGSLPDTLLESELFGHRRGSYTDARQDRPGRFLAAAGGTLLLDEIGNLSMSGQARLLAVLERREFTPLGADTPLPLQARIVSATNLDETALFDPQRFRPDLLYRLNTIVLRVPPLRARREDIPQLATHFLARFAAEHGRPPRPLSAAAMQRLQAHDWPGNVRDLRQACERAVILAPGAQFEPADFQLEGLVAPGAAPAEADRPSTGQTLAERERAALDEAMRLAQGNVSEAARRLGVSRAALYRRLDKHGL
ncbi:sigma-54 dependent transcriptional regulator [Pelomonas sp. APW6]|uniref:Sigma-54 dependent transcriptional regulator n=1 Tax=Roseateles subflavus TaxID=3053353 RepID=A0ABT7LF47_9BURK|nr:sigma-54 dependent transcriptional regulator [Pelomonas sp. APW6]MDL5031472.1 sigma-54 dependent transcriptional regulator [Pelomonas sp. APW6]